MANTRPALTIGDLEIYPLYDGHTSIPVPVGVGEKAEAELADHRRYIPGDGQYLVQFGAYLVRAGDRVILLDAGMGPREGARTYQPALDDTHLVDSYVKEFRAYGRSDDSIQARLEAMKSTAVEYGHLEESMAALGVAPRDITDVVISHFHCDHMGWVSKGGRSFFTNANIWAHEADAEHFLGENSPNEGAMELMFGVKSTKERMLPAMGQLTTWDKDQSLTPGVDIVHYPGHTPGSSAIVLSSRGERAVMVGDVIHCPLEMTDEHFSLGADLNPDQAHESKRSLIATFKPHATFVGSTHFPDLAFGQLGPEVKDGFRSWRWV